MFALVLVFVLLYLDLIFMSSCIDKRKFQTFESGGISNRFGEQENPRMGALPKHVGRYNKWIRGFKFSGRCWLIAYGATKRRLK